MHHIFVVVEDRAGVAVLLAGNLKITHFPRLGNHTNVGGRRMVEMLEREGRKDD